MVNIENKKVVVSFPASCGELVQVMGKKESVCSYAVNLYSKVTITNRSVGTCCRTSLLETGKSKSKKASDLFFDNYNISKEKINKININIDSSIPVGKGMGSSTADIVATLIALSCFFNIDMSVNDIINYCINIEPTDSIIIFNQLCMMNPINGEIQATNNLKEMYDVYCLIPGEVIITEEFRTKFSVNKRKYFEEYNKLFNKTKKLFLNKDIDIEELFKLARKSAKLNNSFISKPYINELMELELKSGIIGINIAHSGSVVAIVFNNKLISKEQLSRIVAFIDTDNYYQEKIFLKMVKNIPRIQVDRLLF